MAQCDSLCDPQIWGSGARTNVGFSMGFCSFHFRFLRNKLQTDPFGIILTPSSSSAVTASPTVRAGREPGKCLQGGTSGHSGCSGGEWLAAGSFDPSHAWELPSNLRTPSPSSGRIWNFFLWLKLGVFGTPASLSSSSCSL